MIKVLTKQVNSPQNISVYTVNVNVDDQLQRYKKYTFCCLADQGSPSVTQHVISVDGWLVHLTFNVPVNNFAVMLGRSHFLGIASTCGK